MGDKTRLKNLLIDAILHYNIILINKQMLGSKAPYSTLKILHKNTFSRLI